MSYTKKAVRGAIVIFIVSSIAALANYLIRIILARNLTLEEYGLFFAILTFINLLMLFRTFGLTEALAKFIPEFQVKKQPSKIKGSIVTVFLINLLIGIIIAIVLFLMSDYLSVVYFKNPLASILLKLFAFIFVFMGLKHVLRGLFRAFQNIILFSLVHLIETLVILGLLFLFFGNELAIFAPTYAYLFAFIVVLILFIPLILRTYPLLKIKLELSKNLAKKLISLGLPLLFVSFGSNIILYFDTLLLTYFRTLTEVGIYNVVVPTAMLLTFFNKAVTQVIFPMVSELKAKQKHNYLRKGILLLQKYSFVISIPVGLVVFSFPELIIKLFFGKEYLAETGAITLQILIIGVMLFVVAAINLNILSALGKPKTSAKILLIGAVFNIITNLFLIPIYGVIGAAITSLLSYLLILVLSSKLLFSTVKLTIPVLNWLKIFFSGSIFIALIYAFKIVLITNVYLEMFLCMAVAGLAYLIIVWKLNIIDLKEIKQLIRHSLS